MGKREQGLFDELYLRNYKRLFRMAKAVLYSAERSEELVHDAFLTYLSSPDSENKEKNPDGWLAQTMKNLIGNELKRASRTECSLGQLNDFQAPPAEEPFDLILPKELTASERQLLIWYFQEGLTHEEIAERLHISLAASRTRVFRAKKRCEELLLRNL